MSNTDQRLFASLTWESTREEVLAAVAEADEIRASIKEYADDEIDWRGDPPEKREGCYSSFDGMVLVHMGYIRDEDPSLVRQRAAGEEDQSQPGWDQGA